MQFRLAAQVPVSALSYPPPPPPFPSNPTLPTQFRVPVLVFFVIPLSAALRTFNMLRQWMRSHDPAGHEERVQRIVDDVKRWNAAGRKQKMRTARPNWAAMSTKLSSNKGDAHRVHTLHLDRILSVDTDRMEITAEPGVTMGEITHRLLPMGLALTVQVEVCPNLHTRCLRARSHLSRPLTHPPPPCPPDGVDQHRRHHPWLWCVVVGGGILQWSCV